MKLKITPAKVKGKISAPSSKSYTHRSILLATLAKGKSLIKNPLLSVDTKYTLDACKKLGASIEIKSDLLKIRGCEGRFFPKPSSKIFCGNSGTTARLLLPLLSLTNTTLVIDGNKRLRKRPFAEIFKVLQKQNIDVEFLNKKDSLPAKIHGGNLQGGNIVISGKKSSQFVSAFLIVSPFAQKDTIIKVIDLVSKPYVDITLDLMKKFGQDVKQSNNSYQIKSGTGYKAANITIEGDYSSASYFFAAAACNRTKITVSNLDKKSVQGDKYFLDLLKQMGCIVKQNTNKTTVIGKKLKPVCVDLKNYPDIVPTFCVVAANANGVSKIRNINHLKEKESNRIKTTVSQLRKMGIKVQNNTNSMTINGGDLKGAEISTYNDHRIAMSFAVACLGANSNSIIKNAQVVDKSYPSFYQNLKKVGAKITKI